jgi:hypothetical protein
MNLRLTVLVCILLAVSACSNVSNDDLVFSKEQYKNACLVTRDGGSPEKDHINYLMYDSSKASQDGIFMALVTNPLGSIQIDCGSVVFDENGQKTVPAMEDLDALKGKKDNTIRFMIVGHTTTPNTGKDIYKATLRLKKSDGDLINYDSAENYSITPVDPSCSTQGCGFIYNKFIDTRLNDVDVPLFLNNKRANLLITSNGAPIYSFDFDVPKE